MYQSDRAPLGIWINAAAVKLLFCILVAMPAISDKAVARQTGSGVCSALIAGDLESAEAETMCLDEWIGLPATDQARLAEDYLRARATFINMEDLEALLNKLAPDAARMMRSFKLHYTASRPGEDVAKELETAMAESVEIGDGLSEAYLQFGYGNRAFRLGGNKAEMEVRFQKARRLAIENRIDRFLPLIMNGLAIRAKIEGEFDVAIERYRAAIDAYEEIDNPAGVAVVYGNIANIFSDLGDHEEAIALYEKAISGFLAHSPKSAAITNLYINMGTSHSRLGQHETAISFFDLARAQENEATRVRLAGLLNFQNAVSLFELGDAVTAMRMAELSIDQTLEHRDPLEAAVALNWLAARYMEAGDIPGTQAALDRAREIVEPDGGGAAGLLVDPGNTYWMLEYIKGRAVLLSALGRKSEATPYLEAALSISEDRFEKEKMTAIANADLFFELRDRDASLEIARQEALVAELGLREARSQILLWSIAAGAVGLIALLLFRLYRQQRTMVSVKSTYLSEIHHRTKNNLQFLSSLISLDARRTLDPDALREGQVNAANRARTMGLVHDHIYNQDDTVSTKIEVRPFLQDLLKLLEQSLGRDNVELRWQITDAKMDVDITTPIGLLVCELVTNAYKYAFGDSGGRIDVLLMEEADGLVLTVQDNGRGFDATAARAKKGSLGVQLVEDLANQIGADLHLDAGSDGALWKLSKLSSSIRSNKA